MFINQAHFEGLKSNEERITQKIIKTVASTENIQGLLNLECWKKEKDNVIEYVLVTKWKSKKDFMTWLSREEHVNEHKVMNIQKKQGKIEEPVMKKTILQYESVDLQKLS
ncbi:antibiotic biosynthesis monooxygenase [Paenibacillus sp. 23TSA30-6]|uniref:antibiotic biosynthesis monooxygenase n=1 Tax=Paenibacillus sp. 23TSA30-6 TaxID=2546104 RepID=UPI001787DB6B|nr:antibiotic biosynthesis monooxygenase [Paenibacillus sp. 23TSA30-6]MBE0337744.1 antibiotic biosynthesis monooxygenase [Paenibacillus sp. 23TSA30-6]